MLPGVRALLDALDGRDDAHLALLTGNYWRGARIKLEYFDLWRYFRAGAFGDHAARSQRAAGRGARSRRGGRSARSTRVMWSSSATRRSTSAVAQAGGARSLAVATGSYDEASLRASGADWVLKDLSEREAVLEALGLASGPDRSIRAGYERVSVRPVERRRRAGLCPSPQA